MCRKNRQIDKPSLIEIFLREGSITCCTSCIRGSRGSPSHTRMTTAGYNLSDFTFFWADKRLDGMCFRGTNGGAIAVGGFVDFN